MMDEKFVNAIAEKAVGAAGPVVVKVDAEPGHVYYMRDGAGNYDRIVAKPKPRRKIANDLDTVADLAGEAVTLDVPHCIAPEIWYDRSGVVVVELPQDNPAPSTSTLRLTPSPQLAMLASWERTATHHNQTSLIRTLRVMFPGMVAGVDLEDLIRRVKVTTNTTSDQGRTRASVGRAIEAQVGESNNIPDYVKFQVPVFAEASVAVTAEIMAAFDFYPEEKLFSLSPVVGSTEKAFDAGEGFLDSRISELMTERGYEIGQYHLYFGRPE